AKTGVVQWVPAPEQEGSHGVTLRVRDGRGGEARQSWVVDVAAGAPGPVITSRPPREVLLGQTYSYDVTASTRPVVFALDEAPLDMTIDGSTGHVEWVPAEGAQTDNFIVVRATDSAGRAARQGYSLKVLRPNTAPVITSSPVASVGVGEVYQYRIV